MAATAIALSRHATPWRDEEQLHGRLKAPLPAKNTAAVQPVYYENLKRNREYFMESALYGIYALVVDVSEIERVSAANE